MAALSSFKFIVQSCRSRSRVTIHSSLLRVTIKSFSSTKSVLFTSPAVKMRRFSFINVAAKLYGNGVSSSPAIEQNGDSLSEETYETAVRTLNTLQSNASTLAKIRQNRDLKRQSSLPQTIGAILASGLTLSSIDNMPIIHISGTKGKGMTCAFTESILRQAGLKTGFFSSPHLTAVRERIRINGTPLSESHFARLFFSVYHKLKHLRRDNPTELNPDPEAIEMPHYFRFLLIMAWHAFLEESVDVVILEVGIGGTYDTTNFISKPICVGITSLGLEHQSVLGSKLEEIALQKAGIMKTNCPAFTVSGHPPDIENILRNHASTVGCPLNIVKPFKTLPPLGVDDGIVARLNASLALHLANYFLKLRCPHIFPKGVENGGGEELDGNEDEINWLPFQRRGLELTKWDGRFQILEGECGKGRKRKKVIYHLDGAHTQDSLDVTLKWFGRSILGVNGRSLNLLVFNMTGDRDFKKLMRPLVTCDLFDLVIFCPFKSVAKGGAADTWSALEENGVDPLEGCKKLKKILEEIGEEKGGNDGGVNAVILESAEETIDYVKELGEGEGNGVKVLVTGSLHLVGCFLSVLQPNRNNE